MKSKTYTMATKQPIAKVINKRYIYLFVFVVVDGKRIGVSTVGHNRLKVHNENNSWLKSRKTS